MPVMPPHRCPTCGSPVTGRHCLACERRRPNAAARGYCSDRWRRFRALQLELSPLCVVCLAAGRSTPATDVDHIVPVRGPFDPRFLDYTAVQSLCHACHASKTAREDSTFARRA